MPASPRFGNAILIHGLGLAAAAAGLIAKWALGAGSVASESFCATGLAAGLVAIVWSVVLALRAIRQGGAATRTGKFLTVAIVVLAFLELNFPAYIGWVWLAGGPWHYPDSDLVRFVSTFGYAAIAPAATTLSLLALCAFFALRSPNVWRRRIGIAASGLAAALVFFIILPCALWVLGAAAKTRFDNGLNTCMNSVVPDLLKVATEKRCATEFRANLCGYGLLPVARLEQNVSDKDYLVAYYSWESLERYPNDRLRIALAVVQGRLEMNPALYRGCVAELSRRLNDKQFEELIGGIERTPPEMRIHLLDAMQSLYKQTAANATVDDIEWKKCEIYHAWWRIRDHEEKFFIKLGKHAAGSDVVARRLAIAALADVLNQKLQATPPCEASEVRVSPEESEEAARILNRARYAYPPEKQREWVAFWIGHEEEEREWWNWFAASCVSDANALAEGIVKGGQRKSVELCAGYLFARNAIPGKVHAVFEDMRRGQPFFEPYVLKGMLQGIVMSQRREFIEDLNALAGELNGARPTPDMSFNIQGALCGLLSPEDVRTKFAAWLSGSEGRRGIEKAARLFGWIHDEKLRMEIARKMLNLPDANDRHAFLENAETLSPMIVSDPALRAAWTETLIALLDDEDFVARRAAAFALAGYFHFSFSAMPPAAARARVMDERDILSEGAPGESRREKQEIDGLRQRIEANKKLKASRSTPSAGVPPTP